MNYLSHFYYDQAIAPEDAGERAYFRVGVMLPDLLSAVDRRARVDFAATEAAPADTPEQAAFYAGLRRHEQADQRFHTGAYFTRETDHLKRALRAQAWEAPRVRCWFLAHVALEILLDSRLLCADPSLAARFYQELGAAEPARWIPWLSPVLTKPALHLGEAFDAFLTRSFLERYRAIDDLVTALQRVMARARQPALVGEDRDRLAAVLAEARPALAVPARLDDFA